MDLLCGSKHLRSSYFCELILHTEFQSNSTPPFYKIICKREQQQEQQQEEQEQQEQQEQ